ncbi:alpha/beta-hydrolase [Wallemia mellicola]|uniref:Alpha/beta-hydrolase n=1 Tax=Wallemia mellicola TaxID=1708541 RepID=A0A4T0TJR6_9BASI|nr:alpha/beta-hydrolase [Wallemia mellicola]TIC17230.1 alpha/beta-hydrolase [Wallemia mellicola]TIC34972.1 alpha/beta-hydrolase [Wallemia mellicola]TIC54971.1 alpha/beta-hydrolase [Wallemia mellicola]TIC65127.1 alpha/beta-hydrolase [Wallemia mellicola]
MMNCCKTIGSFSTKTPKGIESTVADHKVYITSPDHSQNDVVVVVVPDVFGWKLTNTRVLADGYAKQAGVRVYVPDFFNGDHAPFDLDKLKDFNLGEFASKHPPREQRDEVEQVVKAIKASAKAQRIITIGFCWGAPSVLYMGRKDGVADGVAFAHPTMTADEDFELLAKPGLFICAEKDSIFTPDKEKKAREITSKKANNERIYSTWHTFLGTEHHFAVRGDERDPFIARAMGDAQALASNFFRGFRNA